MSTNPNFLEEGRCCAVRLLLPIPRRRDGETVGDDGNDDGTDDDGTEEEDGLLFCSTFGIPNNNFPHTRAVKENPTNMGHDIHNRARSSAPSAILTVDGEILFRSVVVVRVVLLLLLRNLSGRIHVRNGTAIPVFLDDSNNLMASFTVSDVASPLVPDADDRIGICPSTMPRLTSTITRPPLLNGRTALEDQPLPPFKIGKKESE
mmetsp:Transcript_63115/g.72599  ORF Transcript_63115/g.72599 Transcript_63115/m.72599 type:complete len:205 (-) Transcript_63115:591-1205(-)